MYLTTTLFILARLALVHSHAEVKSPPIRSPGQNFLTACGQTSFNTVKGDPTGHIEEQEPVPAGCVLTLCRGMLFSDQPASNVQNVTPGQSMTLDVVCTVPHGGPANVSLVDTTVGGSGQVVGSFLKTFDDFCPTSGPTPADQTNLQFNLPDAQTIGSKCQNAGQCVVQLFWATPDFSQNYYYCVDVAIANSDIASSSFPSSPSSTPGSSPPAPVSSPSGVASSTAPISTPASSTGSQTAAAASTSPSTSAARRRARLLWF